MMDPAITPAEIVADGQVEIPEAQKFLGDCSRAHVYRLFKSGELPWVQSGRRRMVPRRALREYAAARLRGGVANP